MKNIAKVWKSSTAFLLSAFSFLILITSCSNELDDTLQPVENGTLQFVVSDFPMFGEGTQTRVIGTQDEGKTAWETNDEITVIFTSDYYGEQTTTLTYGEDGIWVSSGALSYLENEIPVVSAVYNPCADTPGLGEYLITTDCTLTDNALGINFEDATRTYSRLRIATLADLPLAVTTTGFTPAGAEEAGEHSYTLTADKKGNAYLYGTFAEGATVSVDAGYTTVDYTFTAEKNPNGTEHNKSYALDARPVIDLSQYSESETVEIIGNGRIIGDGNEYNLTLNVADDATIVFEVGTSGVKLDGEITVADGKTLTLRIEGDAEHTVNGGISLGNSSNVIIEGDLTKENNKLTVTATDGNAGIGANNGVTAGDITIRNARVNATGSYKEVSRDQNLEIFGADTSISGAAIGTSDGSMGNILIENSIIVAEGGYYENTSHAPAIGIGYVGSTMGNITLKDSQITARNNGDGLASVIGAGANHLVFVSGSMGDIVITNTDLNLSMEIGTQNCYAAFIGSGIGMSHAYVNMGKIIFTDMTQEQLDAIIPTWLPSDFNEWGAYALGRGYDGCAYKYDAFGGVWVSDGNGGTVQIGDESGYYCLNPYK